MKESLRSRLIYELHETEKTIVSLIISEQKAREEHRYCTALRCKAKKEALQALSTKLKEIL